MAAILRFPDIKRARTEARLLAELAAARQDYVSIVEHGAALLRAAGWREGMTSAELVAPEILAEGRRAAELLLASEAALEALRD
jgi:hypothetical protein